MHSGNFNTNDLAVVVGAKNLYNILFASLYNLHLHSKYGHIFNFTESLTGFVKSDIYLDTDDKLLYNYFFKTPLVFQYSSNIYLQKTDCLYIKIFFQDLICSTSPMKQTTAYNNSTNSIEKQGTTR